MSQLLWLASLLVNQLESLLAHWKVLALDIELENMLVVEMGNKRENLLVSVKVLY